MRHVRFFLNDALSPLSGVLLVRFLPSRAENEHNKPTDKSKFPPPKFILTKRKHFTNSAQTFPNYNHSRIQALTPLFHKTFALSRKKLLKFFSICYIIKVDLCNNSCVLQLQ
jgi:hypothetical protein